MSTDIPRELSAALLAAQGVPATPEGAASAAQFVSRALSQSAGAYARLEFESEPAGYAAAQRRNAP